MIDLLAIEEAAPAAYPAAPSGTFTVANEAVWRRIEQWCRYRWGARTVRWTVAGAGGFTPTLRPWTVTTVEVWAGDGWEATTLPPGPMGYELPGGTFRITATVGDTAAPPADVEEAYKRLAYFMDQAAVDPAQGATSGTDGDYSFTRPAQWAARAIHLSGAADLLRAYR